MASVTDIPSNMVSGTLLHMCMIESPQCQKWGYDERT
jgi:hypothetical protein